MRGEGRAGGAAGSAPGADGAPCPGMAPRYLRDQGEKNLAPILGGEWGAGLGAARGSPQAQGLFWALFLWVTALQPLELDLNPSLAWQLRLP